jgi:hypothetical protein
VVSTASGTIAGFTGDVSDFPAPEAAAPASSPGPTPIGLDPRPWPPARRPWSVMAEVRGDLRAALLLLVAIALAGLPAGLLWWWLAPRASYHITADGPVAVGSPSPELLVADDGVFALILAGLGLLAAVVGWRLRRRRGVATLVALAIGAAFAGVVAWRLGVLLAPRPSRAAVQHAGGTVTTGLDLGALPALAVGPFVAVLAFLIPAAYSARDDLGRVDPRSAAALAAPPAPEPVIPSGGSPRAGEG